MLFTPSALRLETAPVAVRGTAINEAEGYDPCRQKGGCSSELLSNRLSFGMGVAEKHAGIAMAADQCDLWDV